MNSKIVTGLLMVSGFSGSGVVAETSAVEVDGFGVVFAWSASFHAV
jgi:hypothetical protein